MSALRHQSALDWFPSGSAAKEQFETDQAGRKRPGDPRPKY